MCGNCQWDFVIKSYMTEDYEMTMFIK